MDDFEYIEDSQQLREGDEWCIITGDSEPTTGITLNRDGGEHA